MGKFPMVAGSWPLFAGWDMTNRYAASEHLSRGGDGRETQGERKRKCFQAGEHVGRTGREENEHTAIRERDLLPSPSVQPREHCRGHAGGLGHGSPVTNESGPSGPHRPRPRPAMRVTALSENSAIGQEREVHWALQRLDEVVYRHMHDTAEIAHEHMSTSKHYWMARSDKSLLRLKRVEYVRPGPGLTATLFNSTTQHNTAH